MSDLVETLFEEHRRQHWLLERPRARGDAHGSDAERAVMLNLMQSMRRYRDVHHHPLEDRLFSRLARSAEGLLELLRGPARADPAGLGEEICAYAATLGAHHRLEESTVFPAARRLLDSTRVRGDRARGSGSADRPACDRASTRVSRASTAILTAEDGRAPGSHRAPPRQCPERGRPQATDGSPDSAMASSLSS